ncbi:uncharacterized protein K452DRAFT_6453 [Aplosporella prunicola CBS 121167]|uniref:Uncharacterized protein n=1 Tax=Aplosporella prunicola CBS 121167 TaxID=1176127 RepID=A0A6A6BVS1_9PEZI|nr:uncharacterized protein K452DRAFT_6453 [Aplosporella prunicola CBS 121167]KAF2147375.1 hypothetical protein K452DRAFT_6453 [Aplosporella prunicola CBS 121167]
MKTMKMVKVKVMMIKTMREPNIRVWPYQRIHVALSSSLFGCRSCSRYKYRKKTKPNKKNKQAEQKIEKQKRRTKKEQTSQNQGQPAKPAEDARPPLQSASVSQKPELDLAPGLTLTRPSRPIPPVHPNQHRPTPNPNRPHPPNIPPFSPGQKEYRASFRRAHAQKAQQQQQQQTRVVSTTTVCVRAGLAGKLWC